jgi:hypothetical protein
VTPKDALNATDGRHSIDSFSSPTPQYHFRDSFERRNALFVIQKTIIFASIGNEEKHRSL